VSFQTNPQNTLAVGLNLSHTKSSIAKYTIALLYANKFKISSLKI